MCILGQEILHAPDELYFGIQTCKYNVSSRRPYLDYEKETCLFISNSCKRGVDAWMISFRQEYK